MFVHFKDRSLLVCWSWAKLCWFQIHEVPVPIWMWKEGTEQPQRASSSHRQQSTGGPATELWQLSLHLLSQRDSHHAVLAEAPHAQHGLNSGHQRDLAGSHPQDQERWDLFIALHAHWRKFTICKTCSLMFWIRLKYMDMAVTLSTLRSKRQIHVKYTVCQYNVTV